MADKIITTETARALKGIFKDLGPAGVLMDVYTQKGRNDQYNEILIGFVRELVEFDPRLRASFGDVGSSRAKELGVDRSPTLLIEPDRYGIRYLGAPLGEEGKAFILSLVMASLGESNLSADGRKRLERLDTRRHIRVFSSPT